MQSPQVPSVVHKIEIVALSDGTVQARMSAMDATTMMQILGTAIAKLGMLYAQKEQASKLVLPPGVPPPSNLRQL